LPVWKRVVLVFLVTIIICVVILIVVDNLSATMRKRSETMESIWLIDNVVAKYISVNKTWPSSLAELKRVAIKHDYLKYKWPDDSNVVLGNVDIVYGARLDNNSDADNIAKYIIPRYKCEGCHDKYIVLIVNALRGIK